MEMRFFVRMRGAFTPPPSIDVPVMNMPLRHEVSVSCAVAIDAWDRTMLLRRLKDLYIRQCRDLPRRMAILSRGTVRPRRYQHMQSSECET